LHESAKRRTHLLLQNTIAMIAFQKY